MYNVMFYGFSALFECCFSVFITRIFIFVCVLLITQLFWLEDRLGLENQFNHTIWGTVVTPTDRPKSVRNNCVIEVFGGVLYCHFALRLGVRVFVIGLSQICFFFSCIGGVGFIFITFNEVYKWIFESVIVI